MRRDSGNDASVSAAWDALGLARGLVRAFARSPLAALGAGLVLFWIAAALFAPWIAPFDPNATLAAYARPGTAYAGGGTFWLGTDHIGRDILARVIFGSRTVLLYAPLATLCAYLVGVPAGLAAGYFGGWWDRLLSRAADVVLSFPVLVLYVIVIATFGSSGLNILIAVTFASAPGIMRLVRALTLDLGARDFVAAAATRGESPGWIMFVEILPNARGPLVVDACLRLGYVTITIGVLGFLGLGLPPPDPDWGGMIHEARSLALAFPHMTVVPCLAISSLVLGCNLIADGLGETADGPGAETSG